MSISHQADHFYLLIRDSVITTKIEETNMTEGDVAYARIRMLIAQTQCDEERIPELRKTIMNLAMILVKAFRITPHNRELWKEVTDLPYKLMEILSAIFAPKATPIAT